jgi:hypothetical protein
MDHSFTYPMLYFFHFSFIMGLRTGVAVCVMLLPAALPWTNQNGGRNQIQDVSSEMWVLSSQILKKIPFQTRFHSVLD